MFFLWYSYWYEGMLWSYFFKIDCVGVKVRWLEKESSGFVWWYNLEINGNDEKNVNCWKKDKWIKFFCKFLIRFYFKEFFWKKYF